MEVRFYKLTNGGGFSLASYTHENTIPDLQRNRELIEDAAFYIAKEMKKEAAIPVTLVYMVATIRDCSHLLDVGDVAVHGVGRDEIFFPGLGLDLVAIEL